jgi:hypothetical protein
MVGAPANQPGHFGEEKNPCPMYKTQPDVGRLSELLGYKPTKKIEENVQTCAKNAVLQGISSLPNQES